MTIGKMRRRKKAGHFVQLEHYLLDTLAYRTLTPNARAVYVELKRRFNGRNNGTLALSARDAGDAIGATHHTGARALLELQEHGFIEITEESDFKRKVHVARAYLLTEYPDDRPGRSRIASKAFLKWLPKPGSKSKTQSHRCDTTVAQVRHERAKTADFAPNSRTGATVEAISGIEQSHGCDTYTLSASQPSRSDINAARASAPLDPSTAQVTARPGEQARPSTAGARRTGQAGGFYPVSDTLAALLQRNGTNG